jgi:hypothetical protein
MITDLQCSLLPSQDLVPERGTCHAKTDVATAILVFAAANAEKQFANSIPATHSFLPFA